MALQKQDGGIRPILCGEIWCRSFARLAVNSTLVRNEAKPFTSTYDNFIQTAGIRDGVSPHCAKIHSVFYDNLDDTSEPNDSEVIIKIDISNVFNTT